MTVDTAQTAQTAQTVHPYYDRWRPWALMVPCVYKSDFHDSSSFGAQGGLVRFELVLRYFPHCKIRYEFSPQDGFGRMEWSWPDDDYGRRLATRFADLLKRVCAFPSMGVCIPWLFPSWMMASGAVSSTTAPPLVAYTWCRLETPWNYRRLWAHYDMVWAATRTMRGTACWVDGRRQFGPPFSVTGSVMWDVEALLRVTRLFGCTEQMKKKRQA